MREKWMHLTTWVSHFGLWKWWNPADFLLATPPTSWSFKWIDLGLVIALFVLGLIALSPRIHESLRNRLLAFSWYNFFIAGILFLTRWAGIPVLGMDLWRFIQEIVMIIWIVFIIRYQLHHRPKEKLQEKVQEYRTRYLPKPKAR
jgi:hypothetical protein